MAWVSRYCFNDNNNDITINFKLSRENRYMLFLTENYAALDILKNPKNYLNDKLSIDPERSIDPSTKVNIQPFILFGSSFPKDKEYTQVIFKFMRFFNCIMMCFVCVSFV